MITGKRMIAILMAIFFIVSSAGCSDQKTGAGLDYSKSLQNDAAQGLRGALAEDYTRLTIIRGALYKFTIDVSKPQYLGIAIGSLQAMVLTQEYEYERFTKLDNISPEMKKDIIAQPLLNIIIKKRDIMSHAYSDILDPLARQIDAGKAATPEQIDSLNELVKILDRMVGEYATLSKPNLDFNGKEAEDAFFRLQDHHRDLQKLNLPPYRQQDIF